MQHAREGPPGQLWDWCQEKGTSRLELRSFERCAEGSIRTPLPPHEYSSSAQQRQRLCSSTAEPSESRGDHLFPEGNLAVFLCRFTSWTACPLPQSNSEDPPASVKPIIQETTTKRRETRCGLSQALTSTCGPLQSRPTMPFSKGCFFSCPSTSMPSPPVVCVFSGS